jgi:hypothetical protein
MRAGHVGEASGRGGGQMADHQIMAQAMLWLPTPVKSALFGTRHSPPRATSGAGVDTASARVLNSCQCN